MTESAQLPPAGWYPDPEVAGHVRWWDGFQWTLRKPVATTRAAKPLGRGFDRLTAGLGALLRLNMLLFGLDVLLRIWGFQLMGNAIDSGDSSQLSTFDAVALLSSVLGLLLLVAAGVCWMVWQHRLARAQEQLNRSPAMHAWSWAIPIANLWLPVQNVSDLWRRLLPLRGREILTWWWLGWLVHVILGRVIWGLEVDTASQFRTFCVVAAIDSFVSLVTAVLALRIVEGLSAAARAVSPGNEAQRQS